MIVVVCDFPVLRFEIVSSAVVEVLTLMDHETLFPFVYWNVVNEVLPNDKSDYQRLKELREAMHGEHTSRIVIVV